MTRFGITADEDRCIDDDDESFGGHLPVGVVGFDADADAGSGSRRSTSKSDKTHIGSAESCDVESCVDDSVEHDVGSFGKGVGGRS